jgi:hypothetical protein
MYEKTFGRLRGAKELTEYVSSYRRKGLKDLEISPPFDLFPDQPVPPGISPKSNEYRSWPLGERAGVYMIYSVGFEILYIGKASMSQNIATRLSGWFTGGEKCILKHRWPEPPRFLINIAVPDDMPFEAPAIEEYLIGLLKPKGNTCGMKLKE